MIMKTEIVYIHSSYFSYKYRQHIVDLNDCVIVDSIDVLQSIFGLILCSIDPSAKTKNFILHYKNLIRIS